MKSFRARLLNTKQDDKEQTMPPPLSIPRFHRHFEDELEKLRALLIRMGSLVDEQVELASKAVLTSDMESARFVLKREARVNEYDLMVDGLCQRILALTQPVAIDLRRSEER